MRYAFLWILAVAGCSEAHRADAGVDGGPIATLMTWLPYASGALDVVATSTGELCVCALGGNYGIPDYPPREDLSVVCLVPEGARRWHWFDGAPGGQMGCVAQPNGDLVVLISPGELAIPSSVVRLGPEGTVEAERVLFADAVPSTPATVAVNQDFVVVAARGPTSLRLLVFSSAELALVRTLESPAEGEDARITVAVDGDRVLVGVTDSVGGTFVPEGGSALLSFALPDGEMRVETSYPPGRVVEAVLTQGGEHLVVTSGMGGLAVHLGEVTRMTGFAVLRDVAWSGDRVWVQHEPLGLGVGRILSLSGPDLAVEWGMPFRFGPMVGLGDGTFLLAREGLSVVR